MYDTIEKLGKSLIQHGPYNDRIYLMKLDTDDVPDLPARLEAMARDRGYSKVFAKIPAEYGKGFENQGFRREALVPGFYNGSHDAAFLGLYLSADRERNIYEEETRKNLDLAEQKRGRGSSSTSTPTPTITRAAADDVEEMSVVYREVFPSYPFPIHDPAYLLETMKTHVRYYIVRQEGHIAAISSAEMDIDAGNAEMTDFATRPEFRGLGLAVHLLAHMEQEMGEVGLPMLYTIARSLSPGMNIVFARRGYTWAGTLVNNTNISGKIENMNVWYKTR